MSRCKWCDGKGLATLHYPDGGFDLFSCICPAGKWWKKKWQLRAQAATMDPKPERIGRLEEFLPPEALR